MDVEKIFKIIDYVGHISESGEIATSVFLQLSFSIIISFALRICLIFKSAKIKFFGEKQYIKQRAIILNHCGLEILINLIFSYILLLLLNTSNNNLIMNMIIAPLLGQVVAICIDDWYLIPKEKEHIFDKIPEDKEVSSSNTITDLVKLHGMIEPSLSKSKDFRPIIIQSINEIKKVQQEHEEKIDIIANKSDESIKFLSKLQKAAMNDKKIALKDNIYTCLNAGFVTPKERDKIALDYESYCELGGNHEVKNLYEEHFLKLNVHEDRRKNKVDVENDRRSNKQRVIYGEYDKKAD